MSEGILGYDSKRTIRFFFRHVHGVARKAGLPRDEKKYTASVLAHYAQVSRASSTDFPVCGDLDELHGQFSVPVLIAMEQMGTTGLDQQIMETAGAQALLLVSLSYDQMSRRQVEVFNKLGSRYFGISSSITSDQRRKEFFGRMSRNFPIWTYVGCEVHRSFRQNHYLLQPRNPPTAS